MPKKWSPTEEQKKKFGSGETVEVEIPSDHPRPTSFVGRVVYELMLSLNRPVRMTSDIRYEVAGGWVRITLLNPVAS